MPTLAKNYNMSRVTTIKDLAEKLGISTSTVSRILNGKNVSNERLVKEVLDAAKEMNYQVNTAAKGLRTNKTGLIGIVVPEIADDFFASVLSGMEEAADEAGYNFLLCQSNESSAKEDQLIKSLISCNVEGVLISLSKETRDLDFLNQLTAVGKKAVLFDRTIDNEIYPCISFRDHEGAYIAGKKLLETGHKSFLYFGLSENLKNDRDRLGGYNQALTENGLNACDVVYVDQRKIEEHEISGLILRKYDAIVCFNDIIAAQILNHLINLKIRIPEDMSVVGFDNRIFCDYTNPRLSSVEHSTRLMGKQSVNTLLNLLNDQLVKSIDLGAELVLRDTIKRR